MVNNQQLTFEGAMKIVQGNKWIQLKDIERLTEFIQEQQATIEAKNEYQRTLEAKIRRLKDRIKVLEKNE